MERKRYYILDSIRGFTLLNMIVYHAIWDLANIFAINWQWYRSEYAHIWQQFICCTFIMLSGFCQPLGRTPIKRGAIVFASGAVISLVTIIFMPENRIVFGVLTLIGSCMIISSFIGNIVKKIPPVIGFIISIAVFNMFRHISKGYIGPKGIRIAELPDLLYKSNITSYFGFPHEGFFSTDYFPLFPWFFLFLSGIFLFHSAQKYNLLNFFERSLSKPIEWLGRHSLIIYMIHQPVIYAILYLGKLLGSVFIG